MWYGISMATKNKIKDHKNDKEIQYLKKLIRYSSNCIDGKSPILDSIFTDQVNKIQKQIEKLK